MLCFAALGMGQELFPCSKALPHGPGSGPEMAKPPQTHTKSIAREILGEGNV